MTREVLDLHDSGYDISKVIKCIDCQQTLKEENYTPTDEDSKALLKLRFKIVIVCVLLCIMLVYITSAGFEQIEEFVGISVPVLDFVGRVATETYIGLPILFFLVTAAVFFWVKAKVSGINGVVKRVLEHDKMAKRSGLKTTSEMYEDLTDKTNKKD